MKANLAPICMIVYKRREHVKRVLKSLKKNKLAKESEIYFFSDAPVKDEDKQGVEEVRSYLKTVKGFKKVHIVERETNFNYNNIGEGVTQVLETHGRVIVLEDDLEVSPYFLDFMNEMLELYKDDDRVVCVEPGNYFDSEQDYEFYFLQKLSSNGWGTWKDSWQWYERDGQKLWNDIRDRDLFHYYDLDATYTNTFQLSTYVEGLHKSWKIRFEASILLNDKLVVYSGKPLVYNFGNDGTGISGRTDQDYYDYELYPEKIDTSYQKPKLNFIARERMKSFYKKLFHHTDKHHSMIKRLQHILVLEPGHLKSLLQLAYICLVTRNHYAVPIFKHALSNLQEIAPVLQEVLDILDGNTPALTEIEMLNLHKALDELDEDTLIHRLEEEVRKYPTASVLINDLGICYWNAGRKDDALNLFSEYLNNHFPDPRILLTLYDIYIADGNQEQAVDYLKYANDINPNFDAVHLELGNIYYESEFYDKAQWYYHQYRESDDTNSIVNRRLRILDEVPFKKKKTISFKNDVHEFSELVDRSIETEPDSMIHVKVQACTVDEFMVIENYKKLGYINSYDLNKKCQKELPSVSIVMFTYDRLEYSKLTFETLLESTSYPYDLHIIDNCSTDGTIEWLKEIEVEHKDVIKSVLYNSENRGLPGPTNEFWERVDTQYVGKIDNDTLVPRGWLERLVQAHEKCENIGVVGGYHFRPEDFDDSAAQSKLFTENGISVVQDTHIGGCCYLMKRSLYESYGPMVYNPEFKTHGWTRYQNILANDNYIVGYLYPLVQLDYMDDPRSVHCLIDEKYQDYTRKIWKERGVDYTSTNQLTDWLKNDAQRVTNTNKQVAKKPNVLVPEISVILPLVDDKENYFEKFEVLLKQTMWKKFEIIVVDMNQRNSEHVIETRKTSGCYKYISLKENVSLNEAIDVGVKSASCDFVTYIEPHLELSTNTIETLLYRLRSAQNVDVLSARTLFGDENSTPFCVWKKYIHNEVVFLNDAQNGDFWNHIAEKYSVEHLDEVVGRFLNHLIYNWL